MTVQIGGVEYNSDICGEFCYCRVKFLGGSFYNVENKELCRFAEKIKWNVGVQVRVSGNILKSIFYLNRSDQTSRAIDENTSKFVHGNV